jgi:thiol-disulfide isomerase/thioredoxin
MGRSPLLIGALLLAAACQTGRPGLPASWHVGRSAEIRAASLSGEGVTVGSADGVVKVIVVWASWCHPCFALFPALDAIAGRAPDAQPVIVALSVDEDPQKVRESLPRVPSSLRVLWDRGGAAVSERFVIEQLPTVLVVDGAGIVRFAHEGLDERLVGRVDREVRALRSR